MGIIFYGIYKKTVSVNKFSKNFKTGFRFFVYFAIENLFIQIIKLILNKLDNFKTNLPFCLIYIS